VTPGWFPDPSGRFEYRYYNGRSWTADVAVGGQRYVDGGPRGGRPPTSAKRGANSLATAALVCGIVSLTICWLPVIFVGGFVLGVLAVVFGAIGMRRSTSRGGAGRGFAVAGLLTGGFGIAGSVGGLVLTIVTFDAIERYEDPGPTTVIIDVCEAGDGRLRVQGTLRNDGDETSDYTVAYEVRRAGTDDAVAHVREPIDDVEPGATGAFELTQRTTVDAVECVVVDVTGPLPFGVAP
jgi:Protein of unknown function (DUF2510)